MYGPRALKLTSAHGREKSQQKHSASVQLMGSSSSLNVREVVMQQDGGLVGRCRLSCSGTGLPPLRHGVDRGRFCRQGQARTVSIRLQSDELNQRFLASESDGSGGLRIWRERASTPLRGGGSAQWPPGSGFHASRSCH
eukprot:m.211520 g.211520  ORF g.211520 m.211520 type:complete len:139 (+) comp15494_c0_seq3:296-712(+)